MAYQQVYDPMRYVDQTGAMVSSLGNKAASIGAEFFQNNAAWQKIKQSSKNDLEKKSKLYTGTVKLLQEKGIDPNQLNVPRFDDESITPEDYAAQLAKSIQSVFVGSGSRPTAEDATSLGIADQPGVKENLSKQSFLDMYSPMGQINLNGMSGESATPSGEYDMIGEEVNPELYAALGETPAPQKKILPDENHDFFDPLAQELIKQVRSGQVSADKAFEAMRGIKEKSLDLKRKELDAKIAEIKAGKKSAADSVISGAEGGRKVSVDGKPSTYYNPSEIYSDPSKYSLQTDELASKLDNYSGGGSRSKQDEFKLQKAVLDRLKMMNAGDFDTVEAMDNLGNSYTKYVPRPNTYAARVVSDPNLYYEFVSKFFPNYLRSVGIQPPRTSGPAGMY